MNTGMERMQAAMGLQALSVDELGLRAAALARDIEFSANRMLADMVSMGEIFAHVKERTEFGRYGSYTRFVEETGVSKRMAQYSVQAYRRFRENPEALGRIGGVSKLMEVLALPEGQEMAFLEAHDVAGMSVSEVRRAVKAAKGAENAQEETKAAQEPPQEDGRIAELERRCADLDRMNRTLKEDGEKSLAALADSQRRNAALEGLLSDSKDARRRLEDEFSSLRRQVERGETQKQGIVVQMDGATFSATVRKFLADCCEVPQMGSAFCTMNMDERLVFDRGVDMLANFVNGMRSAMNTVDFEEVSIR